MATINPLIEKIHRLVEVITRVQGDTPEFKLNFEICEILKSSLKSLIEPLELLKTIYPNDTLELISETKEILDKLIEFLLYYDRSFLLKAKDKAHQRRGLNNDDINNNKLSSSSSEIEHQYDRLARFTKMASVMHHKIALFLHFNNTSLSDESELILKVNKLTGNKNIPIPLLLQPHLDVFTPLLNSGLFVSFPSPVVSNWYSAAARSVEYQEMRAMLDADKNADYNKLREKNKIHESATKSPKDYDMDSPIESKRQTFSSQFNTLELNPPSSFRHQQPIVIFITGPPGIGKSCYAQYLALQLTADYEDFNDYCIYFDLNYYGIYFMHADGVQNIVKTALTSEVSGLCSSNVWRLEKSRERYHALFSHKRGIIILDNANSQDDIHSLLPCSNTFPLRADESYITIICMDSVDERMIGDFVLSNDPESSEFAHCHHQALSPLDFTLGRLMMKKISESTLSKPLNFSNKEYLDKLTSICHGSPLLLRIATYFATDIPKFLASIQSLFNVQEEFYLPDAHYCDPKDRTLLTHCFTLLPSELQLYLLLLRVFPANFDLAAVESIIEPAIGTPSILSNANKNAIKKILDELVVTGFLSIHIPSISSTVEYVFHPFIRKFSRILIKDSSIQTSPLASGSAFNAIQYRFVAYYTDKMKEVINLYHKHHHCLSYLSSDDDKDDNLEDDQAAFSLFDRNVQHIQAAIFFIFQDEKKDKRRNSVCNIDDNVEDKMSTAPLISSLFLPSSFLRYRFSSRQRRRMYTAYSEFLSNVSTRKSTALSAIRIDPSQHILITLAFGDLHFELDEIELALKDYYNALNYCASVNMDQKGGYKTSVPLDESNFETRYNIQSFSPSTLRSVAYALQQIARCYTAVETYEDAIRFFDHAMNVFAWIGDYHARGRINNSIGTIYKTTGNLQQALKHHKEAIKIYQRSLNDSGWSYLLPGSQSSDNGNNSNAFHGSLIPPNKSSKTTSYKVRSLLDGLACSLNNVATIYEIQSISDPDQKRYLLKQAIIIYEEARMISFSSASLDTLTFSLLGLGRCYENSGYLIKSAENLEAALYIQEVGGNLSMLGDIYQSIGVTYERLGLYNRALDVYQGCRIIRLEHIDIYKLSYVLNNLGFVYETLLEFHEAFQCYRESIAINKAHKNREGIAYGMIGLGNVFLSLEQYTKALQCYIKCQHLRIELNDEYGLSFVLHYMAICYEKLKNYDKSISLYLQARTICLKVKNYSSLANIVADLGFMYHSLGDIKTTEYLLSSAYSIYKKLSLHTAEFFNVASLLRLVRRLLSGDNKNIKEYLLHLLEKADKSDNKYASALIYHKLSDVEYSSNNLLKCEDYLNHAKCILEILIKHGNNKSSAKAHLRSIVHTLGDVYKVMGDVNKALKMYEESRIVGNTANEENFMIKPSQFSFDLTSVTPDSLHYSTITY